MIDILVALLDQFTMKIIIITLVIITLLLVLRFTMAGQLSKENKAAGRLTLSTDGHLLPCPDKPNCINSEYPDKSSQYVPPLDYPEVQTAQVIPLAKNIVLEMGGEILVENHNYLSATFTSSIFRFVDDFEIRKNEFSLKLHIRSASRVGYSDFGVNKRRVEKFSALFKTKINN